MSDSKRKKALENYLLTLQEQMWLDSWDLVIKWRALKDNNIACCAQRPQYRIATIAFDPEILSWAANEIKEVVAHELMHCHFGQLAVFTDRLIDQLEPQAQGVMEETQIDKFEECVTLTTRLMLPCLPGFKWPKADEVK